MAHSKYDTFLWVLVMLRFARVSQKRQASAVRQLRLCLIASLLYTIITRYNLLHSFENSAILGYV